MKITHICLNGPVTDGWSYQDNILPKYHKKLGYKVSIVTSKYIRNSKNEIVLDNRDFYNNEYGIKTIRLENRLNTTINSKFKLYKGLYRTIYNEKPDILFVHGVQFLNIIDIVRYIKKFPNVITYVDNHADFSNSATNFLSKNILHKVIWKYCAQLIKPYVRKFYGVLPSRVDFLHKMYKIPKSDIELLLLGMDDDQVAEFRYNNSKNEIRRKFNIKKDDFLIITGGKIDNAKRQILLLMQAVQQINNKRLKLIVFGSVIDDLKEEIDNLSDGNKVKYIGWVDSKETYKYFGASDLGVFPGRHSVFWEQAAGMGLPLIVKFWEGTTHVDMGGNCHFLYEDSVSEIKVEIENLLNNKEVYLNMKKTARGEGIKRFSYLNIAKQSIEYHK